MFMRDNDSATEKRRIALSLAFLGTLVFSFTFPATVLALRGLDPMLIGVGRAALAAVPAAGALLWVRAKRPDGWTGTVIVGLGVVVGFPVLSTLALAEGASAAHGAVVIGLLPAVTAIMATLRAGERPPAAFWVAAGSGAACVTLFTLVQGGGGFTSADLLFVGALVLGGISYAEGGRMARTMPAWQVICWALVLFTPLTVPVTAWLLATTHPSWTAESLTGFAYVSFFSMLLGFFAWYAGLARAGIARGGQVQLAQPLLTLGWAALFLGEGLDAQTGLAALAVLGCVAWTQRARGRGERPRNPSEEPARV
ncbi:DMT family transporter [Actinocorallia aurantiaca]|uniref:DMT family transporter n=2 Tax=Actinocorallia aurantiaca TaxID=46204 RepID=A0ABP6GYN2_9ACTN